MNRTIIVLKIGPLALLASCLHPITAPIDSLALVVSMTGPTLENQACMQFTPIEGGTLAWSADGSLYAVTVARRQDAWTGELVVTDGGDTRRVPLGEMEVEVGAGVGLPTTGGTVMVTVVPTHRPRFLLGACMGRPDIASEPETGR